MRALVGEQRYDCAAPVTSPLGAFTPFYASYAGIEAPVEHFTRVAAKEFRARGTSVTAIGPDPMDTPFSSTQPKPPTRLPATRRLPLCRPSRRPG